MMNKLIVPALILASSILECECRRLKKSRREFFDVVEEEREFYTRFALLSTSMPLEPPCNIPPQQREASITAIAASISGDALIADESAPQGQALDWLINMDALSLCPSDISAVTQRYVIAVIHLATGIESSSSSLSASPECQWDGVKCIAGVVTELSYEEPLGGFIPEEIGELGGLTYLDIEEANLVGTIPTTIGNLGSLVFLDLNKNSITGSLPDSLYDLSNLQVLDLDNNLLTGTISSDIGDLQNLSFIQMESNLFSGTIPDSLGNLLILQQATFDDNQLTGTMPATVCANRGDGRVGGFLLVLNADCPPQFTCDCCTVAC